MVQVRLPTSLVLPQETHTERSSREDGPDHPRAIAGGDYLGIPECTVYQQERLYCYLTCSSTDPLTSQLPETLLFLSCLVEENTLNLPSSLDRS